MQLALNRSYKPKDSFKSLASPVQLRRFDHIQTSRNTFLLGTVKATSLYPPPKVSQKGRTYSQAWPLYLQGVNIENFDCAVEQGHGQQLLVGSEPDTQNIFIQLQRPGLLHRESRSTEITQTEISKCSLESAEADTSEGHAVSPTCTPVKMPPHLFWGLFSSFTNSKSQNLTALSAPPVTKPR